MRPGARGFTLVEVLVALGIVAVALGAGVRAIGALDRDVQRQRQAVLAQLCAENELIRWRLAHQMPGVGDSSSPCPQSDTQFTVQTRVRPTPNPNFLRIEAQVYEGAVPLLQVATVMGRY